LQHNVRSREELVGNKVEIAGNLPLRERRGIGWWVDRDVHLRPDFGQVVLRANGAVEEVAGRLERHDRNGYGAVWIAGAIHQSPRLFDGRIPLVRVVAQPAADVVGRQSFGEADAERAGVVPVALAVGG